MAWPYFKVKWRDKIRQKFMEETGLKWTDPTFEDWLKDQGYIA